MKNSEHEGRYCRNCYHPMPERGIYCPNCSQKYHDGRVPFREMLADLVEAIFNFDSRVFRTVGAMFVPGKLTVEYFKGKHIKYVRPMRLFFLMGILHFTIMSYLGVGNVNMGIIGNDSDPKKAIYALNFQEKLDSVRTEVAAAFNGSAAVRSALDSIDARMQPYRAGINDSIPFGYLKLGWQYEKGYEPISLSVAVKDMIELSEGHLMDTYGIEGFFARLQVQQFLRMSLDGNGFSRFLLGQLIWMVILMMPALALILKLLYIRRKRYYIEHLVFSFHYHAVAFFVASIGMLIGLVQQRMNPDAYIEEPPLIIPIVYIIIVIYLFFAMKKVYNQGFFKTFAKYLFIGLSYLILFTVFFVLTIGISVLVFQ